MQHVSGWVSIAHDRSVYVQQWEAAMSQAIVCIVHGLGEHAGRYEPIAQELVKLGLTVYAFDQQGHGHHPGRRGSIESYSSLLNDIAAMLSWIRQRHGESRLILMGHSMGGNLVINYALRNQWNASHPEPTAIIASSPMLRAMRQPGRMFGLLARSLLFIAPNYRLQSNVIAERLMSDPVEQRRLKEDTMFHSRLSLRLAAGLVDSGRWALQNASKLSLPMLLTHGTRDVLTCPKASQEFAARAGKLCIWQQLDGHLHDPFRDLDNAEVIQSFAEFALGNHPRYGSFVTECH